MYKRKSLPELAYPSQATQYGENRSQANAALSYSCKIRAITKTPVVGFFLQYNRNVKGSQELIMRNADFYQI